MRNHSLCLATACLILGLNTANASDSFAAAPTLAINSSTSLSTTSSTSEAGEPAGIGFHTEWFRYVAPTRGIVRINVNSPSYEDILVTVYRGNTIDNLTRVKVVDDDETFTVSFPVEAGMDFRICVADQFNSYHNNVSFTLQQSAWPYGSGNVVVPVTPVGAAPGNNEFSTATVIPSVAAASTVLDYNLDATQTNLGPEPDLAGYRTLWYRWIAPARGIAKLSTPASDSLPYAHGLSVYRGNSLTALTLVEEAFTRYTDDTVSLAFPVEAGLEYRICFGSYYSDSGGSLVFSLRTDSWPYGAYPVISPAMPLVETPVNDQFEGATALTSKRGKYTIIDYNRSATTGFSDFEPDPIGYRSLWYRWKAPESSFVQFLTPVSPALGYDHVIAAYQGANYESLVPIAAAPTHDGAKIGFYATKGVTYHVSFCTYYESDEGGPVVMSYESGPQVNTTAPTCKVTYPANKAVVSKSGFYISGTISNDPEGLRTLQVRVNGKVVYSEETTGSIGYIPSGKVKKGPVKIEIRAQDGFGRWGAWAVRYVKAQ